MPVPLKTARRPSSIALYGAVECKRICFWIKVQTTVSAPTLPAPNVASLSANGKWQREYDAFLRLRPQLLEKFPGEYVVIHDGQVLASGRDDIQLALQFFASHGNVPVHIGLVTAGPVPAARIPHYRELNPRGAA